MGQTYYNSRLTILLALRIQCMLQCTPCGFVHVITEHVNYAIWAVILDRNLSRNDPSIHVPFRTLVFDVSTCLLLTPLILPVLS